MLSDILNIKHVTVFSYIMYSATMEVNLVEENIQKLFSIYLKFTAYHLARTMITYSHLICRFCYLLTAFDTHFETKWKHFLPPATSFL